MTEHFQLSPYREGDQPEILSVFERVFGVRRSDEHWRWQFGANPYDPPKAVLAREKASGAVIGQYTVMPLCLNVMGRPVKAGQSLDTMVHPDHRMHGIFEASAKECYSALRRDGYGLVYGFPNRNSFPGFVRKLGWNRVAFPVDYSMTLSIRGKLRRRLRLPIVPSIVDAAYRLGVRGKLAARRSYHGRNSRALALRTSDRVPPGYDELWNAVKSFEILSLWKDAKYFGWRYDANPAHRFTYHYLARGEAIDAICVSVVANRVCHVLELIVRGQSVDLAKQLMAAVGMHALRQPADSLRFTGATLDFFDEVFKEFHRVVNFGHVFCLIALSDDLRPLSADACNWTITGGDADTY